MLLKRAGKLMIHSGRIAHGPLVQRLLLLCCIMFLSGCGLSKNTLFDSATQDSAVGAVLANQQLYSGLPNGLNCEGKDLICRLPSPQVRTLPAPAIVITSEVQAELKAMLKHDGIPVLDSLGRRQKHYPLLSKIFDDEGVPRDLLNLAMVESGFRPEARSPVGALGMWQFMKATAKLYGLKVTKKEDQRKDVVLSTIAAARHLKDLFSVYGDWYLTLAAYNAGPGSVGRALLRTASNDFWKLARSGRLSTQTVQFVPRFLAATILARTYDRFGAQNLAANVKTHIASITSGDERDMFAMLQGESDVRGTPDWTGIGCPQAG